MEVRLHWHGKKTWVQPRITQLILCLCHFNKSLYLCNWKKYNNMAVKHYTINEQPTPSAAEPAFVYGNSAIVKENGPMAADDNRERMSVDEYFDELWSMYLTKRENLRA